MILYSTLASARGELRGTTNTIGDNVLVRYLNIVSRRVDMILSGFDKKNFYFAPVIEERKFLIEPRRVNVIYNVFHFPDNLLEITTVTRHLTDITSQVEPYSEAGPPYRALKFIDAQAFAESWYPLRSDHLVSYLKILGTWGYHSNYANAWYENDLITAGINAVETGLVVSDVDGVDYIGVTPRFSTGSLIKIEDEVMRVVGTNSTTNTLTVVRGQCGTTAAAHAINSPVEVWQFEPDIERVVARQTAMLYAKQGSFQVESVDGVGSTSYPEDLQEELKAVLSRYTMKRIR